MSKPTGDGRIPVNPSSVGLADVAHLEKLRGTLGSLNEQFGSASQHQATLALWQRSVGLLGAKMTDRTRSTLLTLCARLGATAGWSAADLGDNGDAQLHFGRALCYADQAHDPVQAARALAFAARSELQWGSPEQALKLFQFGDVAADRAGSHLLRATINIHGAQAAALTGWPNTARSMTSEAVDEFGAVTRDDPATPYPWGDIASARAAVRFALGDPEGAVDDMTDAAREVETGRVRSQAFRHARLARCYLAAGSPEEGVAAGHVAVESAQRVRSARVLGRLAPVADAAAKYHTSDARDLTHEVRKLTAHR